MAQESARDLLYQGELMEWGKARIGVILEALKQAEAEGNQSIIVDCYSALSRSYRFCGEVTKMVAPFLWLDKFRTQHPEAFDYYHEWSFASDYKSFVRVLRDLPTASVEQNLHAMKEMERIYIEDNFGLKPVHLRYYFMYKYLGMLAEADKHADIWLEWKTSGGQSDMDDCAGCDPEHMVTIYQDRGDHEQAVKTVERVLIGTHYFCENQPDDIKTAALTSWLAIGEAERAWEISASVLPKHLRSSLKLCQMPVHLRYLASSALNGNPEHWQTALALFNRILPWWRESETPRDLMDIATQSAFVLHFYPYQHEVLTVVLPGADLPWITAETVKKPTVAQAHQWCAEIALSIAAQFDRRPGLPAPFEVVRQQMQIFDPPLVG